MIHFPELPAASASGTPEISALADAWARIAVRAVLEPDEDDILKVNLDLLCRRLRLVRPAGPPDGPIPFAAASHPGRVSGPIPAPNTHL